MNAVVPAQKIAAEIQYGAALSGPDPVMALLYEIRVASRIDEANLLAFFGKQRLNPGLFSPCKSLLLGVFAQRKKGTGKLLLIKPHKEI
jgi:hypothetical protein